MGAAKPKARASVLAVLLAAFAVLAIAGCGGDESTQSTPTATTSSPPPPVGATAKTCDTYAVDVKELQVTGVPCGEGRRTMYGWQRAKNCAVRGAARGACTVKSYRCLAVQGDRGVSVSCARPGHAISFIAKR